MRTHIRTFAAAATLTTFAACAAVLTAQSTAPSAAPTTINLSTSKRLLLPVPGTPQSINALPTSVAVSPDGHWLLTLNAGYGSQTSHLKQSISVLDLLTGAVTDVPEDRTASRARQTYFSGLAFSADGHHVFASMASLSNPTAVPAPDSEKPAAARSEKTPADTGTGIAEYTFAAGTLTPATFHILPLVPLAAGHTTDLYPEGKGTRGVPYPAAIALIPARPGPDAVAPTRLLIAENLTDTVAILNTATGVVEHRFDLATTPAVPSAYPVALAITRDGRRAFVALWNASTIAELDLVHLTILRTLPLLQPDLATAPGSHPCALLLDEAQARLFVALSNRDAVAAVNIGTAASPTLAVAAYIDTRLPGQQFFGAEPVALALNAANTRLYIANMGTNSIAVVDARKINVRKLNPANVAGVRSTKAFLEPKGFLPTELMPLSIAFQSGKLYVATNKGKGTGPNKSLPLVADPARVGFTYAPSLLYGSLATLDAAAIEANLAHSTRDALDSNLIRAASDKIAFSAGANPIRHVIYIIKENRTYDQVFGDLTANGQPVGNGDPSLTMYGAAITPNLHQLALQFGVLDNFYDSGEISGSGHVWSTAAIGTDYLEKTWPIDYRGRERTYDFEGMVSNGYPLLQHIADVNEPNSGYLWTNLARHGKSLYHFGEYISSVFCDEKAAAKTAANPQDGAMSGSGATCPSPFIQPGEPLPAEWGGGKNLWPWPIPRLARNIATKPELVGHFAPETPDFNLKIPDQIRTDIFLRHLELWKQQRAAGHDTMPQFIMLRLANDHTGGTRAGGPTPKSSVADNDLAVGRAVDAISHSAYWDDTAFFILEDDAQNGGDHVDAHRSLALVISKYSPHPAAPFVDSRFYTTVSVVRTMESLLDLPPMNANDAFAPLIGSLFAGPGTQPAFNADAANRDNGLIYTANKPSAPGAAASAKMDFRHADRADAQKLNLILWEDAMGAQTPPPALLRKLPRKKDKDDD